MSAKKPSKGVTASAAWHTCAKCRRRIPRSALAKHSEKSECDLIHPFIFEGDTHTLLVSATTTSKIQNLPFIKSVRLSSSCIFMPEELIRESGFKTFGWVTLQVLHDKFPIALRVWPIPESIGASSVSGSVMMTKDGFLANNISASENLAVKIGPFSAEICAVVPPAESVLLEIDDISTEIDLITFEASRFIHSFKNWFRGRLVSTGNYFRIRYYAEVISFWIKDVQPKTVEEQLEKLSITEEEELCKTRNLNYSEITEQTRVEILFKSGFEDDSMKKMARNEVTLNDVGGMDPIIKELVATINFIFSSELNVARGILLYGHSGTGKSFLVDALCNHFNLTQLRYNEFASLSKESSSNSILKIFQDALSKSPSAIIIENLDSLAPSRSSSSTDQNNASNFALTLQSLIPLLSRSQKNKTQKVLILATATDADSVDSSLRSPKIFGKEVELPVPSKAQREQILNKMLLKINHNFKTEDVNEIAGSTHGFVGADLLGLFTQTVQSASERCDPTISLKDMIKCLKSVKPSAIKSILVDVPNVRWDDIGGQNDLKFKLKQAIEWPLKHPEAFQRLGITPPKGILMYGPPGCSKTMIAKAIATESGLNFISVKGSELFSKWVGESEKAVREVFKKARQVSPCVVFFDEIDSLGGERGSTSGSSNVHERVLAQLLIELDGIEPLKDVTIVAATNRPDIIDQALLRPGRLDRIIYVPLPDAETRREILKIQCRKMPVDSVMDIEKIVVKTEGYSGAELTALCHEAAMKALELDICSQIISEQNFQDALDLVKPRICQEQIDFYENYSISHKRS